MLNSNIFLPIWYMLHNMISIHCSSFISLYLSWFHSLVLEVWEFFGDTGWVGGKREDLQSCTLTELNFLVDQTILNFFFLIFIIRSPILVLPYIDLILSDCENHAITENHNLRVLHRTWKVNNKVKNQVWVGCFFLQVRVS